MIINNLFNCFGQNLLIKFENCQTNYTFNGKATYNGYSLGRFTANYFISRKPFPIRISLGYEQKEKNNVLQYLLSIEKNNLTIGDNTFDKDGVYWRSINYNWLNIGINYKKKIEYNSKLKFYPYVGCFLFKVLNLKKSIENSEFQLQKGSKSINFNPNDKDTAIYYNKSSAILPVGWQLGFELLFPIEKNKNSLALTFEFSSSFGSPFEISYYYPNKNYQALNSPKVKRNFNFGIKYSFSLKNNK